MALSYVGGKNRIAPVLIHPNIHPHLDKIDVFCEVFSGAFWTYIQSDEIYKKVDKVIYNDFSPYMSNLFRCASDPKTFSKFIDKKNPPLQTKGKPELSQPCKDFFYECKEALFYTDYAIKKIRNVLEDKNITGKHRKALNEALTHARATRQCNNNSMRDAFGDKVKAARKNQNAAMRYAYILTNSNSTSHI